MMKKFFLALVLGLAVCVCGQANAAPRVDIYGPGQNVLGLGLASPLTAPSVQANGMGAQLHSLINANLNMLPFLRLTDPNTVPGGTVLAGVEPPSADLNRFVLAGSDIVVTTLWPSGDSGSTKVQMRVFETGGARLLGKEYGATPNNLPEVADRFCSDLLEVLTGNGMFFRSTLCYTTGSKLSGQLCTIKPTGRDQRVVASPGGRPMSPCWSKDNRHIAFALVDKKSHSLGIFDTASGRVQRVRFPNSVVISPAYLPNNQIAVALSHGDYPAIFLLTSSYQKSSMIQGGNCINVSPSFDSSGSRMAFTSSRLGGPQIFMSGAGGGGAQRVSMSGNYNTEPNISPDGTLIAFSRQTGYGNRIFVQDMVTGAETQVSFGPGSDEQPSFCGDSYFIAFTSTRGGGRGIYLTTRHGGDAKMVVSGGASFPRWNNPK